MLLTTGRRAGHSLVRQASRTPLQLRSKSSAYAREFSEAPSGSGPVDKFLKYLRRRSGNADKPEKPSRAPPSKPVSEVAEATEESTNKGVLVKVGGPKPADHQSVFAVALSRRPIMPGTIMPIRVKDERLIAELEEMRSRGTCYVGAFLKKNSGAEGEAGAAAATDAADRAAGDTDASTTHATAAAPSDKIPSAFAEPVPGEVNGIPQDAADHLHEYGTFGQVHNLVRMDESGGATLIVMGHRRLKRTGVARLNPLAVTVTHLRDEVYDGNDDIIKATANEVVSTIKELLRLNPLHKEQLAYFAQHVSDFQDPAKLADLGASMCSADEAALQEVVESTNVLRRLELTLVLLKKEMELSRLQADIGKRVEEKISTDQRKYFLNEQLKSIQKELGLVKDERTTLTARFEERLKPFEKGLTEDARRVITEEMNKLKALEPSSSEFNVTRNYLEWLTSMPWGHYSQDILDVKRAQTELDADHYGLEDVKERILEFIAVAKLRGSTEAREREGKILCLVGPPGVGKTSIGRSIANALGRKFYRFSVGGLGDIVEIKGHRRTYVGSMPGKLVQCLKATGVSNPLVLIDEIDKLGRGMHGDPASALLELLDPEQNSSFLDHYLDVPIDASKVLFVCTANSLDTIPGPLLDRMEIIRLSGYIAEEKVNIARTHLERNARDQSGVKPEQASLSDDAVASLIEDYAREPGVRSLQKYLEKIYRKVALKVLRSLPEDASAAPAAAASGNAAAEKAGTASSGSSSSSSSSSGGSAAPAASAPAPAPVPALDTSSFPPVVIGKGDLPEYLGPPPMPTDKLYDQTPVGVVTGLAWTSMGGSTLYIECTVAERGAGKGGTMKTGQLGDVMRESADIAHTFARVMYAKLRPGDSFFEEAKLHLHVPAGATPKDGPSAGCTLITAMLSKALERPVAPHLAMTGEVTLTGRVLPVGGIKEKTIAARRSGVKTLILPGGNRRDFGELPKDVTAGLEVHFVDYYDEVYKIALAREGEAEAERLK